MNVAGLESFFVDVWGRNEFPVARFRERKKSENFATLDNRLVSNQLND